MKKTEIVKSMNGFLSKTGFQLKKHSPEILVVAGVIGVVTSAVMACKATTKVDKIVENTKNDIDKVHTATATGVTEAGESYSVEDSKKGSHSYLCPDRSKNLLNCMDPRLYLAHCRLPVLFGIQQHSSQEKCGSWEQLMRLSIRDSKSIAVVLSRGLVKRLTVN